MEERWREPAALAEQYAGMLYRLAYARTGSRADAEDVMQEVFVRLLRARPEFRDEEHAKAWLLRVGARCAADVLRAPWRRREGPLDDALPAPEPPGEGGVVEAVLALPAKYRTAVHLYYYEELSVAEIAAVLGKSEGAVKSRLFRARALLRRYLKEDGDVSERLEAGDGRAEAQPGGGGAAQPPAGGGRHWQGARHADAADPKTDGAGASAGGAEAMACTQRNLRRRPLF